MSKQVRVPKKIVALGLTGKPTPQLITDTEHYLHSMTGNSHFPNPNPVLSVISGNLDIVKASYAISVTRVKGAADKLHADAKLLHINLKALAAYVESIANQDPDHAADIIATAGMAIQKPAVRKPKVFSVKQSKIHGEVMIDSKAVTNGFYYYDMSTDPNLAESSWVRIYGGSKVKFVKGGLTIGTRYFFRTSVVIKSVQGNPSSVVSLIVQ